MSSPRVLVFDSGVGGLSIAEAIRTRLPDASLLYLADNACFPYGDQSAERVEQRCVELITSALARHPVDVVVIACNTASTIVLPALRAAVDVPVVGVVPAIKPAARATVSGRIGLLATPATVSRPYLEQLIADYAPDCELTRVGSSELVRMAENALGDAPVPSSALEPILTPLIEADVDTVVLGCTHFPLLRPALEQIMGPQVTWVDSGEAIARRVASLLEGATGQVHEAGEPQHRLLFTGSRPKGIEAWASRNGLVSYQVGDAFS